MNYQSTRGKIYSSDTKAVLQGIAPDGGLFIDPEIKNIRFDWEKCLEQDSFGMAEMVLSALLPSYENMKELVKKAYIGRFESEVLTPLVSVGDDYVLELFRGPTSAFKDVALSMLPQLMTAARKQEGIEGETVILTATSGDTGKAALEGFHDVDGTRIMVFYPYNGVSAVQKAQMVTQTGSNVKVCAVKGNFDDCQQGVKKAFAQINSQNLLKGSGKSLSSANSINIGRLAPQVVYYFIAYSKLISLGRIKKGGKVDYVVPTGNFGDILAGYFAKLMGLPVGKLVCASNANKVLTDFLNTGVYDRRREFVRTSSPSMDILVSSNLERLLYLAADGDTEYVSQCMDTLGRDGIYTVKDNVLENIRRDFAAGYCDEAETEKTIDHIWKEYSYLCDPHTAVAISVAEKYKNAVQTENALVVLSTASPYKFPAAVLKAIGGSTDGDEFEQMETLSEMTGVAIPSNLSGLRSRETIHNDVIDKDEMLNYILEYLDVKEVK